MKQPWLKHLMLRCPELLLAQIGGIIVVGKCFALAVVPGPRKVAPRTMSRPRLVHRPARVAANRWPSAVGIGAREDRVSEEASIPIEEFPMKIVVVANSNHSGVINRFGKPCPERYARRHIRLVVDALAGSGHEVTEAEGGQDPPR